ncbi:MAG: thioredoxin family protein [Bdellovibrionaceae bacterium]|nr:thioredoxin family protein [Pseudobdellovibrionaceae bacterium]
MALTYTPSPDLGQSCPEFSLPATDGQTYARADFFRPGSPTVIMFICNHCPYVKAIEERLVQLGRDLKALGVPVAAISANDAARYAEDSFEKMKEKSYPFPYLYDDSQSTAHAFGAVCTPDFFVYDNHGRLAFRGRLDDSWKDPSRVTKRELFDAVLLLKEGQTLPAGQAPSMGCSIKWKG